MSEAEKIRASVAEAYAGAVTATKKQGCCGGGSAMSTVANLAGYDPSALSDLPDDAVGNAFGCGDPTAFAEVQPGQVVLDLGSGAGIDLLLAARKVGPTGRVIGVDMTDEMIERARANVEAAGLTNVEVRKGIIEALPVDDASVDWVISNCVINLSPEKERVFAEIARVLKPGGKMAVSDIVVEDIPAWMREAATVYSACIGGAISEAEYLAGLVAVGLADAKVVGRFVYDASQLKAMLETDGEQLSGCCGSQGLPQGIIDQAAAEVAGRIASARIVATKG